MSLRPSRKSSSMFSICVPAFRRWELHQAVKVCEGNKDGHCGEPQNRGETTLIHQPPPFLGGCSTLCIPPQRRCPSPSPAPSPPSPPPKGFACYFTE